MSVAWVVYALVLLCFSGSTFARWALEREAVVVNDDSYCFISFGCWGGHNRRTQAEVAAAMGSAAELCNASFILAAGDNFYLRGVKSVDDPRFKETFEDVYTHPAVRHVPWLLAMGNHDYRGNIFAQVNYTGRSERWYMPNTYYSKVIGKSLLLVVIDCTLLERCQLNRKGSPRCWDNDRQKEWLRETLVRYKNHPTLRFRIVMGHYPLFANGPHVNQPWLISLLTPLFDDNCVDMYIHADNHYLQLSRVKGVFYFNSGGGGGYMLHKRTDKGYKRNPASVFEVIGNGLGLHRVRGDDLETQILDTHGRVLHTFNIHSRCSKKLAVESTSGEETPEPSNQHDVTTPTPDEYYGSGLIKHLWLIFVLLTALTIKLLWGRRRRARSQSYSST